MNDDEEEGEISTPTASAHPKNMGAFGGSHSQQPPPQMSGPSLSQPGAAASQLSQPQQQQQQQQQQVPLQQPLQQQGPPHSAMRNPIAGPNNNNNANSNDFRGPRFGGERGVGPPNARPFGAGGRRHGSFSALPAHTTSMGGGNATPAPNNNNNSINPMGNNPPPGNHNHNSNLNINSNNSNSNSNIPPPFREMSGGGPGGRGFSGGPPPRDNFRGHDRDNFRGGDGGFRGGGGNDFRGAPFKKSPSLPLTRDGGGGGPRGSFRDGPRGFRDRDGPGGPPHPRDVPPFGLERSRSGGGGMSGPPQGGYGGGNRGEGGGFRGGDAPRPGGPPPSFGPRPLNNRDIPPPRRESFGDGPQLPRDRPFRDDGGLAPPLHRGGSQGGGGNAGGFGGPPSNLPMDPRRPTDPRRRGSAHESGPGKDLPGPEGGHHGPPGPGQQNRGRMGSYSSLADSSSIPPSLLPSQPPHDANYRSPAPGRRNLVDQGPRGGDRFGPGGMPSQRQSWSPAPERRPLSSSPRSMSLTSGTGGYNPGSGPPMAPSLSSRGGGPPPSNHFRDPRLKGMDNNPGNRGSDDIRPDMKSSLSGPPPRMGDSFTIKKKGFPPLHSGTLPLGGPSDGFGPRRDHPNDRPPFKNPRFSPSKQGPPSMHPGRGDLHKRTPSFSNGIGERASSAGEKQKPAAPTEAPKPKLPTLPPLRTSVLGPEDIVQRAEAAVLHLSEVVGKPDLKASGKPDELSLLPAKQVIMSAVTEIEKLAKEAQKDFESCEEEKKEAIQQEAIEEELDKKRKEEEKAQKLIEEKNRKEQEEKLLQERQAEELKNAIANNQGKIDDRKKSLKKELEDQIAEESKKEIVRLDQTLAEKIADAEEGFMRELAKVKASIEKSRTSAQRLESKVATAELEYQALLNSGEADVEKEKEESKKQGNESKIPSLIEEISAQNQLKAGQAHVFTLSMVSENDPEDAQELLQQAADLPKDPKYGKTFEEWSVLAKQVSNLSEALYTEPSEAPYFQRHEEHNALLSQCVREYIRDKNRRLTEEWTDLAEEYEVRKRLYEKQQRKLAKKALRGSISVSKKSIFAGGKETKEPTQGIDRSNILESGGRSSNNPYRRARRGNEVRSEYEQEQIIAEIAAKEAMEKRIAHGGCKVPRQVSRLERGLTASFVDTFTAKKIDDPLKEAKESEMNNLWTDMEKCIYLDRFLQFPKDFRRIASFLKNRTTKDCIAFYYDSKQTVPFKGALKEHVMRRKRKGDYQVWDASIQAAVSVGAKVVAGSGEDKPVEFQLPESDKTYRTYMLHPLRRPVLDKMEVDESSIQDYEEESRSENAKWKSRKRGRDPLFTLDKEQTKYLRLASQESTTPNAGKTPDDSKKGKDSERDSAPTTPVRKPPQKWTVAEKKIFIETLEQHGRDWVKLAQAVGTKNEKQIKNFYYDWKKGKSRTPSEKKGGRKEKGSKSTDKKDADAGREESDKTEAKSSKKSKAAKAKAEEAASQEAQSDKAYESSIDSNPKNAEQSEGRATPAMSQTSTSENAESQQSNLEFATAGNRELIQQLLNQQMQQQQQQQLNQQIHLGQQQPQSAIQQLLSQQHLQREQHQQNQLNQLSLDEARRLLEHQQSQRGSVMNNLLSSPWLTTSQLLQAQAGLPSHAIAAALRGEASGLGGGLNEIGDIQRYLQIQQATQGLGLGHHGSHLNSLLLGGAGGLSSASNSGLNAALLSQLEGLSGSNSNAASEAAAAADQLSLANAQSLLGFAGTGGNTTAGLANALLRQSGGNGNGMESAGVSDALALLARSMQRGDGNERFN